jgi:hypothetical protein
LFFSKPLYCGLLFFSRLPITPFGISKLFLNIYLIKWKWNQLFFNSWLLTQFVCIPFLIYFFWKDFNEKVIVAIKE